MKLFSCKKTKFPDLLPLKNNKKDPPPKKNANKDEAHFP